MDRRSARTVKACAMVTATSSAPRHRAQGVPPTAAGVGEDHPRPPPPPPARRPPQPRGGGGARGAPPPRPHPRGGEPADPPPPHHPPRGPPNHPRRSDEHRV